MPRFKGTMPGKNYLYDTLRGFDEISKIFHIDKSTLEKLKRYFILMLMGIIGNSELFHDNIEQMINTNIGRISELHDKLEEHNQGIEAILMNIDPQTGAKLRPWHRREVPEMIQLIEIKIEKVLENIKILKEKRKFIERFRNITKLTKLLDQ